MNQSFLKGDCSTKLTPKSSHPWRNALYPHAQKSGRYSINHRAIAARRAAQIAAAAKPITQ